MPYTQKFVNVSLKSQYLLAYHSLQLLCCIVYYQGLPISLASAYIYDQQLIHFSRLTLKKNKEINDPGAMV